MTAPSDTKRHRSIEERWEESADLSRLLEHDVAYIQQCIEGGTPPPRLAKEDARTTQL